MKPLMFAGRRLSAQPARAALGVLGLAAVGALLFDMLMLSRGLALSFEGLLEEMEFDVRVTATTALPGYGPMIDGANEVVSRVHALPEVEAAFGAAFGQARLSLGPDAEHRVGVIAADGTAGWTVEDGRGLTAATPGSGPRLLVSRLLAGRTGLAPGDVVELYPRGDRELIVPPTPFEVVGIADFLFDQPGQLTVAMTRDDYFALSGDSARNGMDVLLVRSTDGVSPRRTLAAVEAALPELHVFTNAQFLTRFDRDNFSYFRQISFVLSSVTLFFAFLLVATLLTVAVNQRFAEIAALRALGFSRRRVVTDLCCESVLLVGGGVLVSLPLGIAIARWLDVILKDMEGIPTRIHFFVVEPRSLLIYLALMVAGGLLAAIYPVWLASRLPIAATLRRETVG